ncbi:MAG TPA: CocE/NonD family hydrolase [Actinomycetota bacterium]|nr:CocE/NonD family hydrolase [Actinomycetota bacterium]
MRKRVLRMLLATVMMAGGLAAADTPYPVIGEPVLRSDTQWIKTGWGYQSKSLTIDTSRRWPVVFTMEGYAGATRPAPNAYLRMDDGELMALRITFRQGPQGDYAMVQASTRGTECSGGSFNLYDRRHAWDGHHIIEWIGTSEWSNGNVGMFGSSFPGQTGYWVASTKPRHLKAVSANLLHSDIYRDIFMPGGVQNYLFPIAWTYAVGPHRLPQDAAQRGPLAEDEICQQNQATRYMAGDLPQAQNEPVWAGVRSVDDQWYSAHAARTYADSIKIPYYQQVNWQDEQVGSRAVVLFNHIDPDPTLIRDKANNLRLIKPKKFVVSNGDHGHGNYAGTHRWAFFDIFLRGLPDTTGLMDSQISHYFEAENNGAATTVVHGNTWPHEGTQYVRAYAHEGGSLDFSAPTGPETPDVYLSGASRHGFVQYSQQTGSEVTTAEGYPDAAEWTSAPLTQTTVVGGPLSIDLYASLAGTDTDFFVSVSDVFPDGRVSYLTRGLLKASHRAIDPLRSYYDTDQNGKQIMVQPYRPHSNPQPVMPGEIVKYNIEIFPLGYIFRPGHKIMIKVHTPPVIDGIWGYTPTHHQPAPVTIHHDATHPTSVLLPVVNPAVPANTTTPCPLPGGFACTAPSPLSR